MKKINYLLYFLLSFMILSCQTKQDKLIVEVYETSASGNSLTKLENFSSDKNDENLIQVKLLPAQKRQTITGFGGSFTESSASLLNQLSKEKRDFIIEAYFGETGAKYSLTRTHMNSCDFSISQYSYAPVEGDKELKHFTIEEDKDDIIPMIKDAMKVSKDGFKILSSPWTASPWMKDNKKWVGGKLLPEYYDTWALFFSKYVTAYKNEGIDISQTIAVGDGANDLPMLNLAGLGIAFHAKPTVKNNAQSAISSIGLDGVLYLLGYHDRHIDLMEECTV